MKWVQYSNTERLTRVNHSELQSRPQTLKGASVASGRVGDKVIFFVIMLHCCLSVCLSRERSPHHEPIKTFVMITRTTVAAGCIPDVSLAPAIFPIDIILTVERCTQDRKGTHIPFYSDNYSTTVLVKRPTTHS